MVTLAPVGTLVPVIVFPASSMVPVVVETVPLIVTTSDGDVEAADPAVRLTPVDAATPPPPMVSGLLTVRMVTAPPVDWIRPVVARAPVLLRLIFPVALILLMFSGTLFVKLSELIVADKLETALPGLVRV